MTFYARFIHLCLATALSSAVAIAWLYLRLRHNEIHAFVQTMTVAVILGLVVPAATTLIYARARRGAKGRMLVYYATCAGLLLVLFSVAR